MVMFSFCLSLSHIPRPSYLGVDFLGVTVYACQLFASYPFASPLIFKKLSGFDFLGLDLSMLRWTNYPLPCSAFDSVSLGQPLSSMG